MFELDYIDRLIIESEPLEAFEIDEYADFEEIRHLEQNALDE